MYLLGSLFKSQFFTFTSSTLYFFFLFVVLLSCAYFIFLFLFIFVIPRFLYLFSTFFKPSIFITYFHISFNLSFSLTSAQLPFTFILVFCYLFKYTVKILYIFHFLTILVPLGPSRLHPCAHTFLPYPVLDYPSVTLGLLFIAFSIPLRLSTRVY